ncbi:MAG: DUF3995 domain-containing protein [Actinobacteria bacterium]|nr:DUF3995 domain-containing protein [Actinomycetota bacterium]
MTGRGTIAAYAAAVVAFGYAAVSLYWAACGRGLLSTIGGYAEQAASSGGAGATALGLADVVAKVVGGLLALALVQRWGRAIPQRGLLIVASAASVLLVVYGGLYVLAGALVLANVVHPAGTVDRTALRWHTGVWDLWFLVWGILLAVATVSWWRSQRRARQAELRPAGAQPRP